MNAPTRSNPYLSGNFAPIRSEDDFVDLPVEGAIPPELSGTYFRNGPNPQFDPRDNDHHWFAGDGMLHAFSVKGGKSILSQPLCANAQVAVGAWRGRGIVRNLR